MSFRVFPDTVTRFVFGAPVLVFILITSACYVRITRIASRHRKRIVAEVSSVQARLAGESKENQQSVIAHAAKQQQKSTGLFLTMNTIFTACWLPFLVNCLLAGEVEFSKKAAAPVMFLAMSNSGMNFVIYALKNEQFARAYRRLLRRCCCCQCEL